MAKFFKTVDDLKKFISVTKAYSIEEFETRVQYAVNQYLKEWVGTDQLDALDSAYQADPTPPMSPAQSDLLDKIQPPLANLTFYEHIPFAQVLIDDSGIQRKENDNFKTAYANQVEMLRRNALVTGYNSIETLMEFLEENEGDYPLWVASDGYTKNKSLFINSAKEFNSHYPTNMSRLMFTKMFSIIEEVEEFHIIPTLGPDFYAELKQLILSKGNPTAPQSKVMRLVRKAVARFTIAKSCEFGWSDFTPAGLVSINHDSTSNAQIETTATDNQVSLKIRENIHAANQWIHKLEAELKANIGDYPTYAADTVVNPTDDDDDCPTDNSKKGYVRF